MKEDMNRTNSRKLLMFLPQDSLFITHFIGHAMVARELGFNVTVMARCTSERNRLQILDSGCEFVDSKINRSSISILDLVKNLRFVYKTYSKIKPDLVHHFGTKAIFLGTLTSFLLRPRPKVINNLIGLGSVFSSCGLGARILQILIVFGYRILLNPSGSRVICENKDDLSFFIRNKSVKIENAVRISGAGVNVDKYCPISWGSKERKITVVMCSRLLKSKGVIVFLEAAEALRKMNSPVQMWLIGGIDPNNPDSLSQEEILNWKKKNVCEFFGFQRDVEKFLQKAHIFALPSYYREGIPKSLLEAASSGLAIITTNTTGCREVVANNNGFLIPTRNTKALVDAILQLVSNTQLLREMGDNSRALAISKYSSRIILRQIRSLYLESLKRE